MKKNKYSVEFEDGTIREIHAIGMEEAIILGQAEQINAARDWSLMRCVKL